MRIALLRSFAALSFLVTGAQAQTQAPIKVGVLTDMSSLFSGSTGAGSVEGARLALEEFGPTLLGRKLELVFADHQNKTDVGAEIARKWYENEGVEVIADVANSAVSLAVQAISQNQKKIALFSAPGVADLSGKACSPLGLQWTWDSNAYSRVVATQMPPETPDTWFAVVADYAYGISLERDVVDMVKARGGTIVGSIRHPINSTDFASYLVQAADSKAKTILAANGGGDLINFIKQSSEFGLTRRGARIVAASLHITDVHSMGLAVAQGVYSPDGFYWDFDDKTRAWSKKFFERRKSMPTSNHVGAYSAVLHWLKAVQAAGTLDATKVMAQMKAMPVEDVFARNGFIREDGRMVHDMFLLQVKTPAESKGPWDYYKVIKVVAGKDSVRPLEQSECPLVKKG